MYINEVEEILREDRIRYVEVLQIYESHFSPVVVEIAVTEDRTALLGIYEQDNGSYKIQKIPRIQGEGVYETFMEYVEACNVD